jgi:hypothetical protein
MKSNKLDSTNLQLLRTSQIVISSKHFAPFTENTTFSKGLFQKSKKKLPQKSHQLFNTLILKSIMQIALDLINISSKLKFVNTHPSKTQNISNFVVCFNEQYLFMFLAL